MKNKIIYSSFKKIGKSEQIYIMGGQSSSWVCSTSNTSSEKEKKYLPSGCQ